MPQAAALAPVSQAMYQALLLKEGMPACTLSPQYLPN
jgi:hypothetical protein